MNFMRCMGVHSTGFLVVLSLAGGCTSIGPYRAQISSEEPAERILAVRAAAEAKDWRSVPLIVDRLEDEDDAVRFYAILALERITGERFGYDYSQTGRERAASVSRWRTYVKGGKYLTAAAAAELEDGEPSGGRPGA
ncbi:hypothetical protein B7486_10795 [cyanobacterium TDX16]|nr:hypothetical protein B7486_10795 [cyanobacterium TDX16]